MRIAVWGINYAPELTGIGPYNRALCEHLVQRGHEVEMFTTFPYYPMWRKRPEDVGRIHKTEMLNGVKVHRCWHWVPTPGRAWKRILHELSFVAHSAARLLFTRKFEILVVVSPPLLLGFAAWWVTLLRGGKYIFHIQDLQPDAAATLGMLKPGLFMKALYWLEKIAYQKAWKVSGISEQMLKAVEAKGVPRQKLVLFPNGVSTTPSSFSPAPHSFRQKHSIGEHETLAVYSGNVGYKQGLPILLDTARLLETTSVRIVIAGDGAYKPILEAALREAPASRILMLPIQSEEDYAAMLADADVCLIPQIAGTGALFLPSKLLKILAVGKPLIATCDTSSALAEAMVEGDFGRVLPAEGFRELAEELRSLHTRPADLIRWGENGKKYVTRYEMTRVLENFEITLKEI